MIRSLLLAGQLLLLSISTCNGPQNVTQSPASPLTAQDEVVRAAQAFINSLSELDAKACLLSFSDSERENWNFVPLKRKGLALQLMNEKQRRLVANLLQACLSQEGYRKVEEIRQLESVLTLLEGRKPGNNYRNAELYYIAIFGKPADSTAWGWRFEGHHLSLNYTYANGQLTVTPQFMGANPAKVPSGAHEGKRVLAREEDEGRALVQSLDAAQLERAVIAKRAYPEIITGNDRKVSLANYEGLAFDQMTASQQSALIDLIQLYLNNNSKEEAKAYWEGLQESGVEKLYFAWAGGIKVGERHYYRIHGPRILIEYDNTQNGGNHIHTVCRDPSNDFGDDVLKLHYQKHKH